MKTGGKPFTAAPTRAIFEKARGFLPCLLLTALFALCAALLPEHVTYQYRDADVNLSAAASAAKEPETIDVTQETRFRVLREYHGRIGVFFPDGSLERVLEIDAASLPAYDRRLLEGGIVTSGQEELQELLESLRS